ncbi:hypothetical protein GCM10011492_39920 [Flexivirga endophytica]|uniref:NnrS family protein n=1 Tax=Flexivirga endophytica TaxID=1849103 RepID=A0A916X0W2_9MICO|nr:hypothetical protein [Flexivirga endophytica]GGB44847.1 hypothetical protein GCM10011492_39920 [Flexivirga endophytica]GHB68743.1 hypothetical protein GCM10008112_41820 [Flexivirga endophytica]
MAPAYDAALSTPRRGGATRAPLRAWLLVPAGLSLLAGLDAALLLADAAAPVRNGTLPARHGVLMTLGFLGTLIALERSVALRAMWGYAAPALLGAGGSALAVGLPAHAGAVLLADGGAVLVAVYGKLYQRQHDEPTAVEALGAVAATGAAVLWLRLPVSELLLWLVAFVVLTIAAERVELARLHLPARAGHLLIAGGVLLMLTAVVSLAWPDLGDHAAGGILLLITAALARHDVARHTIRSPGVPRLSAAALLGGYAWLAVAAGVWLYAGTPTTTAQYDTAVHGVFLGFGMSMVIAHAPVILPAVIRRPMPYHPMQWLPLVVLHLSLVLRLLGGNALGIQSLWTAGALLGVVALLLLPLTMLASILVPGKSTT